MPLHISFEWHLLALRSAFLVCSFLHVAIVEVHPWHQAPSKRKRPLDHITVVGSGMLWPQAEAHLRGYLLCRGKSSGVQLYKGGVWVQSKDSPKLTAQPAQVLHSYTHHDCAKFHVNPVPIFKPMTGWFFRSESPKLATEFIKRP